MKTRILLVLALAALVGLTRPTMADTAPTVRVVEITHEPTSADAQHPPYDQPGYYFILTKGNRKLLAGPIVASAGHTIGSTFETFLDGYDPGAKLYAVYQVIPGPPLPPGFPIPSPSLLMRVKSGSIPSLFGADGVGKTVEDLIGKCRIDDELIDRVRVARISHEPTQDDIAAGYPFSWRIGEYFILKSRHKKYVAGPFYSLYSPTNASIQEQVLEFLNKAHPSTRVTAAYISVPTLGPGVYRETAQQMATRNAYLGAWYDPD